MRDSTEILNVKLPNDVSIKKWCTTIGRNVIFPELLIGCEQLLYDGLDKVTCLIVSSDVEIHEQDEMNGLSPLDGISRLEIVVRKFGVERTLDEIMEFGLKSELYLLCSRVKSLQDFIKSTNPIEV